MTKATYNKEYHRKYREEHGDILREYSRGYYKENRQYFKDYYRDKIASKRFVYSLWAGDRCLYVGSCISRYRISQHLRGGTHLELVPEQWEALKVDKLIYSNVTDITRDNKEREYIERLWIDMYKPLLNGQLPDADITPEKMEILEDIVYNGYVDTQEMDIKKITLPDGKVTFDFDNLILQ